MLVITLPGTRPWRATEGALTRLTGSRSRSYVLVTVAAIAILAGVNIYQLVH